MRASITRTLALCAFLTLFLTGCELTLQQVSSATLEHYEKGLALQAKELSQNQVRALSDWFSQHGSGWSLSVVSYVPALLVRAKHTDGETSTINIMTNLVVVNNRGRQYQQLFTPSELAEMRRIVETQ